MSKATDRLRNHVASYKSLSSHRQNCLDVCAELEQAQAEIDRLQALHLERTKSTHKALTERDQRIEQLEAAATYLSAEVKDAWDLGRISVDTFHVALAMDKALIKDTTP